MYPGIPAAANSLNGVHQVLTDPRLCGWPADRVTVLADPYDSRTVATLIRRLAGQTSEVLLLYYVGHGVVTDSGELCLTLIDTDPDDPDLTGLEYRHIRAAFNHSPARVKVVILDCCYSGRAIEALSARDTLVADHTDIRGVYTLTAADLEAHTPPPDAQKDACTSFTGELLELIRTGVPGQEDPLTLGTLYLHLRHRLYTRGLPAPNQRGTDTAHSFGFTRNAARFEVSPTPVRRPELPGRPSIPSRDPIGAVAADQRHTRRQALLLASAVTVSVGGALAFSSLIDGHRDQPHQPDPGTAKPTTPEPTEHRQNTGKTLIGRIGPASGLAVGTLDGKTIAVTTSTDGAVRVWDLATLKQLGKPFNASALEVAMDTVNGKTIALTSTTDDTVRVWDLATREQLCQPLAGHSDTVTGMAVGTLDGKTVAVTGGADKTVRIWDLAAGKQLGQPLTGHTGEVWDVALTTLDGETIAVTGSNDTTVRVWDLAAGKQLGQPLTGHTGPGTGVSVAAGTLNGKTVAVTGGADKTVRIWDLAAGKQLGQPLTGHTRPVLEVAMGTLDGKTIAVTCGSDKTVRVWDLAAGRQLGQPLTGHTDTVWEVAVGTLDNKAIAVTGSMDYAVKVWDLSTL
ncbi:caspase, EACC1-associated type [Nonomuraea sp. CA-143628]|uniref:caspase, EACC1-associated type n=1 Tax=Nonomuraea sp. CA-143628 TaxID=3239997 RepID=UPI003D9403E1